MTADEGRDPLGWWVISGSELLRAFRLVADGESPDAVYAEFYANSDQEHHEGDMADHHIDPDPAVRELIARSRATALRDAADAWQRGEWADAPRRANRVQERIANGRHVYGWLRARADREALR